ncbi:CgeB family protein [Denitromonas iodatirespirans]|uniref:Glycosyltransferase n=1 Tax=Denitromonas iodatirespirans TaxID=2795389 RepID=A0A944H9D1_DENI1|nr:glycosyltransferase [Denitromonas iodatirespirans]MBT0962320.1 glycosyltransferase [Denitromonas iodatirespirans]
MRVLVVGDWHSELHEEVVFRALSQLGHDVHGFKWHHYFSALPGWVGRVRHVLQRLQDKFVSGPLLSRINRDLLICIERLKPEVIFFYRGTHVTAATLREIRRQVRGVVLVGYNNDDPFAPHQPRYLWRHFLKAVPEYDLVLAYRHANLPEYRAAGARRVELLRSWYVPERNHPVTLSADERERFEADVVFVGHYEPDQRIDYLEEIVRQGFRLRLFGPGYDWNPVIRRSPWLRDQIPVQLVWGEDYNRALCGAKIALCFFSKLNRDTYTRRCFEIPATRTLMLSEYSDDLATLFEPGEEVALFATRDEMMAKIREYLADDALRSAVAHAGCQRVLEGRHDVGSRMEDVMAWVSSIQGGQTKQESVEA